MWNAIEKGVAGSCPVLPSITVRSPSGRSSFTVALIAFPIHSHRTSLPCSGNEAVIVTDSSVSMLLTTNPPRVDHEGQCG